MRRVLLAIAYGAVGIGQFVLPVIGVLWIEHALGGRAAATWLALLAFLPLFALTGVCFTAPLWRALGRAAGHVAGFDG